MRWWTFCRVQKTPKLGLSVDNRTYPRMARAVYRAQSAVPSSLPRTARTFLGQEPSSYLQRRTHLLVGAEATADVAECDADVGVPDGVGDLAEWHTAIE